MRDLKYLVAYVPPILTLLALSWRGPWVFATVIFAFGLVPILDRWGPQSSTNFSSEEKKSRLSNSFFDYLLYANVPLIYAIVAMYMYVLNTYALALYEYVGLIFSVGVVLGASGINVGHELGHRRHKFERFLSKALLLPNLYTHFFIEHNRGHHKYVATPEDPATSRYNEPLYIFWLRTLTFSYRNAWKLEAERLRRLKLPILSWKNEMLRLQVAQIGYILTIFFLTNSWAGFWALMLAALVGVLNLETVNYIEHYGLVRKRLPSGAYERVRPIHSWNSNHELGRILLYELTRHSDHHYLASKKYQVLDHHEEAPELPFGYPAAMLTALVPPLWFAIMNKRLRNQGTHPDAKQAAPA